MNIKVRIFFLVVILSQLLTVYGAPPIPGNPMEAAAYIATAGAHMAAGMVSAGAQLAAGLVATSAKPSCGSGFSWSTNRIKRCCWWIDCAYMKY
ncbi:hypothetical protein JTE90_014243 [Oedothorax gibbosus]|uniref:Uncharacterized protein n=1 Tax=Oedothorax gibbosus TaxID=931172 RepID=A0AAV6U8H6_9ARAC|nr:hypothetical protein JTE90_014243 [Oedothorax gibbosus]